MNTLLALVVINTLSEYKQQKVESLFFRLKLPLFLQYIIFDHKPQNLIKEECSNSFIASEKESLIDM